MPKKVRDLVIGANRGPFLTNEPSHDSAELEKADGLSLTSTPKGKKFQRHWKRYWFVYLVGNTIFLAIFLPIFFLIILPAVAQLVVNKSSIYVVGAKVLEPKPDSVIMSLHSKVNLKIVLPARIEPLTFHLFVRKPGFGPDYPYADTPIPGRTIVGNYSIGVNDVYTPILNMTSWTEFVHQIVFQEETTLSLRGQTNAYLGILKSHVYLNKDVHAPSLNKFAGLSIADSTLLIPGRQDGTNLLGNITLPNPTVLSFEVGTLNLDIMSGDLVIGNATMTGVTLVPGDNTFPMAGTLDLKKVIGNLAQVFNTQLPALKNGKLSLNARTTSVVWNGTLVPYYTEVLRELTLTTTVGVGDIIRNTLEQFVETSNLNLTSLSSGASKRSLDVRGRRVPHGLAGALKENAHLQDLFGNIDPARRDAMIDTLLTYYPQR